MTDPSGRRRPSSTGVVVFGSIHADLIARVDRFPQPGEIVRGKDFYLSLGGKAANQAVAAARHGAATAIVSRVGDDFLGEFALEQLRAEGVETCAVLTDSAGTGVSPVLVGSDGDYRSVIIPRACDRMGEEDVVRLLPMLAGAAVLVIQLEVPVRASLEAAEHAKAIGVTVLLNAAPPVSLDCGALRHVDVLVVNEREALALAASTGLRPRHLDDALEQLTQHVSQVVVTIGSRGCILADEGNRWWIPGYEVAVCDTVGAGDTFTGVLAAELAAGRSISEALPLANAAGALATTKPGAYAPTSAELDEFVRLRGLKKLRPYEGGWVRL